jgi:serine/threonine-protein kinase
MATVHLGCLLGPAGFSKLVAIKRLHEELAREHEFVSMLLNEARLASAIHHPNVVGMLDVVTEDNELLVVMEYVHGETLAALLRSSRQSGDHPPVKVVVRILCDALEGLHAAHVASLAGRPLHIVHRDVSPQNIMAGADGNTRVLDFGIAQAALSSRLTAAGVVKGKIAYMSPEQVQGRAMDARTDIFAAGIVLWEALTGRRLFLAADAEATTSALLKSRIVPPSEVVPNLPRSLDQVVLRALDRRPERRFQTGRDFAEALRRAAEEGSRREVADWVGRVASDGLAQRLELIEALEASALHTPTGVERAPTLRRAPITRAAPMRDSTPTRVTSITSVVPEPKRKRRWPAASWWVAAGALLSVTVVGAAHLQGTEASHFAAPLVRGLAVTATSTARPSANPPPPLVADPPPPSTSTSTSSPAAAVAPAPLLVESLPLVPDATVLPTARVKRKRRAARPSAASAPSAPVPPASVQATTNACASPYGIDETGARRLKPECL